MGFIEPGCDAGKTPDYKEIIDKIKKLCFDWINCDHRCCSMAEGGYEEKHGKQILDMMGVKLERKRRLCQ